MFQIAIIHPGLDHLKSDRKYKVRFVKRCTNSLPLPILFYLFLTQKDQRDTPYTNLNLRGDERWNLEPWKRWRRYSPAHPAEHTLSPCSWQKLRWKHQMPNPQNSKVMIHGWFHHEFWGSKIRRKHTSWHKLWMAQSSGWKVERKQKSHAILIDRFRSFQMFSPPKVPNVQASKGFYGFPKASMNFPSFVGVTIQASKCSYSQPKVAAACFAKASFRQAMMTRNPASWKFGPKKCSEVATTSTPLYGVIRWLFPVNVCASFVFYASIWSSLHIPSIPQ